MKTKSLLLFLLLAMSVAAKAETITIKTVEGVELSIVYYSYISDVVVASCDKEAVGVVTIPDSVFYNGRNYCINEIGSSAFEKCTGITEVKSSKCSKIYSGAFRGCSSLTSVYLPSCTTIGYSAFSGCTSLTSVGDLSSCMEIGGYAFSGCTSLTSVDLSNCTAISDDAFSGCTNLTSVDLSSCTSVGSYAFDGCTNLTSVGDLSNCTTIGSSAFRGCSSLTLVDLSSCTEIGSDAFLNCKIDSVLISDITSWCKIKRYNACSNPQNSSSNPHLILNGEEVFDLEIPEGIRNVDYLCYNLRFLRTVHLPSTVKVIGTEAFDGCDSLSTINIEGCTEIGNRAFRFCKSLSFIDCSNVKSIGDNAFSFCYGLSSIDLPNCVTIGYGVFVACHNLSEVRMPKLTNIPKPESWTSTSSGTFDGCDKLQKIDLSGCTSIGDYAFSGLINLLSVDLSSCTSVGRYAFSGCTSLTSVDLSNCTAIGYSVFSSLSFIEVIINNPTPPTINSGIGANFIIYVPAEALETYRSADVWKDYADYIFPIGTTSKYDVTTSALESASGLQTVIGEENLPTVVDLKISGSINGYDIFVMRNYMPNLHYLDMTDATIVANPFEYYTGYHTEDDRLGGYAFYKQEKLCEVRLPKSITYIGNSAFYDCLGLQKIEFHEGLRTIDDSAFGAGSNGVYSIDSITLPEGLLSIGRAAFVYNRDLKYIHLPNSLRSMGEWAFEGCRSLKSITLPPNVEDINRGAFQSCSSLTSVVLPANLRYIGASAFSSTQIKEIHIPPTVETIAESAFNGCPLTDVYVYIANAKDIKIDMNTFPTYKSATLHIPDFSFNSYYWDTQWGQFYRKVEFSDTYESFYTD